MKFEVARIDKMEKRLRCYVCKKEISSKKDLVIANELSNLFEATLYLTTYHKNCFEYKFPKIIDFRPIVIEKVAINTYNFLDYASIGVGLFLVFNPIILHTIWRGGFNLLVYLVLLVIAIPFFYFPINNISIRKKVKALPSK